MITNDRNSRLLKQVLLAITLEIVLRTVWRICILMFGRKGLIYQSWILSSQYSLKFMLMYVCFKLMAGH